MIFVGSVLKGGGAEIPNPYPSPPLQSTKQNPGYTLEEKPACMMEWMSNLKYVLCGSL